MTLSTEIIHRICNLLVLGLPPKRPCRTSIRFNRAEHFRRTLWSLCLVSRRIGAIATEYLYKAVIFESTEQRERFKRTMTKKPDFRGYPQCMLLEDNIPLARVMKDLEYYFTLLHSICSIPTESYDRELSGLKLPALVSRDALSSHHFLRQMHAMLPRLQDTLIIYTFSSYPHPIPLYPNIEFFAKIASPPSFLGRKRLFRICLGRDMLWVKSSSGLRLCFQIRITSFVASKPRFQDLRYLNMENVVLYEFSSQRYALTEAFDEYGWWEWRGPENKLQSWIYRLKALHIKSAKVGSKRLPAIKHLGVLRQLLSGCKNLVELVWVSGDFQLPPHEDPASALMGLLRPLASRLRHLAIILSGSLHGPLNLSNFVSLVYLWAGIEVFTAQPRYSTTIAVQWGHQLCLLLPSNIRHLHLVYWDYTRLIPLYTRSEWLRSTVNVKRFNRFQAGVLRHIAACGCCIWGAQLLPPWFSSGLQYIATEGCRSVPKLMSINIVQPCPGILPSGRRGQLIEVQGLADAFASINVTFRAMITEDVDGFRY
ncbi:hypothetical protein F4808DRAFT_91757 [Astrocystis sublimbata]|nr:hypothetical protein F4808DRAFT_91757 [Astrocystis sublimbata]